jgi:hypothetical protein
MALAKVRFLSEVDVLRIAEPILAKALNNFGYCGLLVEEVEDFDGAHIFRLTASVVESVPARVIIDANQEIHVKLRTLGEDRFAILSTKRQDIRQELVDEDMD